MDDLTLPAAIAAFITATNAADSDQFVAQFTPDAVLDDWGTTYNGPAEIASGIKPTTSANNRTSSWKISRRIIPQLGRFSLA